MNWQKTIVVAGVALCAIIPWAVNQLSLASLHSQRVQLEELARQQGIGALYILQAEGGQRK
jgi:hypothetical protein